MNAFLKSISFIFHPLLMPMFGVVFFFSKAPLDIPLPIIKAKLIAVFALTIVLPILLFYLLKSLGQVKTIYLASVKERVLPLALNCIIVLIIAFKILPYNEFYELYFFFVGILFSTLACLIMAILKFKASIHMIASAGIIMFFMGISIHYSININGTLALFSIIIGAIATSRIHVRAHTNTELIIGFFIGLMPQLILFNYWL